jgi:alpha-glucosidase (family GH31 glycosyl hydrolase)
MDAYLTDKDGNGTSVMYNVHSLYATLETMATQKYLLSKFTNRTFVLSRGSFVGHGKYGTMWTGDTESSFEHLRLSQSSLMTMSIMGLPFVGADI